MKSLKERFKEIGCQTESNGTLLCEVRFGSHLYGLNTPNSDFDYKGVYLPSTKDMVLQDFPGTIKTSTGIEHEKNKPGDIDREYISLHKFVDLAVSGDTLAIDMLHADGDNLLYNTPIWDAIVSNRKAFYTKSLKSLVGYLRHQAAKYGIKGSRIAAVRLVLSMLKYANGDKAMRDDYMMWSILCEHSMKNDYINIYTCPESKKVFLDVCGKKYEDKAKIGYVRESLQKQFDSAGERALLAEKNEGVDWKALSHAFRVGFQAKAIYQHGDFTYPLKENDFILQVKSGSLDYKRISPILEELVEEVFALAEKTNLPEQCDRNIWKEWLWLQIRQQIKRDFDSGL